MCPFIVGVVDGEYAQCGEELEIEWVTRYIPPARTGHMMCIHCGVSNGDRSLAGMCETFEGELVEHQLVDEYDDGNEQQEVVSIKSYCFHPITRAQATGLLDDLAIAQAEKRAEG